jgi:hypothetical protein
MKLERNAGIASRNCFKSTKEIPVSLFEQFMGKIVLLLACVLIPVMVGAKWLFAATKDHPEVGEKAKEAATKVTNKGMDALLSRLFK